MTKKPLILTLDQGTTSSRALVFDDNGAVVATAQMEFAQHFPASGFVEHDCDEVWETTLQTARQAMSQAEAGGDAEVVAIGIANQRETTLTWNRDTGEVIGNAIVWQDRRTSVICEQLRASGREAEINQKTGLTIDPYFSGTKLKWILENRPKAAALASQGKLAFGTIDSFLIFRLTGMQMHRTDETNASRTMLYNIKTQEWDDGLLAMLDIPRSVLPTVQPSASEFGMTSADLFGRSLPIRGVAGDQQAAAFGQACFEPGMIKSTYGTGCFLLANTGEECLQSQNRLLSTIACRTGSNIQYALEGSIFIAGAVSQWLRDQVQIIETAADTEALASSVDGNGGVYFVPAFTGLGAPHWDADARGALFGLTRATDRKMLARAALEAVGYQTQDLLDALKADGLQVNRMRVDGGMVENSWFLQFLADITDVDIDRPSVIESTARGAAFLAGLQSGVYKDVETLSSHWTSEREFSSKMSAATRGELVSGWHSAVKATLYHAELKRQR